MSLPRRIDWSASLRSMRNDRVAVTARAAGIAAQNAAKVETLRAGAALVVGGSFDRAAIMAMAVRNVRRAPGPA